MVETYLSKRKTLKGVVLIMDVRRTPGLEELNFIDWLNYYSIQRILVLTKTDKLSKTKQIERHNLIAEILSVNSKELILFSAKSRIGKDAVWDAIKLLIDFHC